MNKRKISKFLVPGGIAIILLLLLSGLSYLNELPFAEVPKSKSTPTILKTEITPALISSNHKIDVTLFTERKYIAAIHELIWVNTSEYSTSEVQFHLYPNAFRNNKSVFMEGRNQSTARSEIKFDIIKVNNHPAKFIFIQPEIPNKNDHTAAKILLNEEARPGDTVRFFFSYKVQVPESGKRFGYASGRNFFFISQWYPKPGVFEGGKWICSQYHPYTNFYSDFGTYDITISVPGNYQVGSSGGAKQPAEKREGRNIYRVKQDYIHDFAWMASDEITRDIEFYKRSDGSGVEIISFIQPENIKYKSRFINAIKNSFRFFEEYIGVYPYNSITLVDAPRTSLSGGMEYPTLITVGADLFSPVETQQPESVTIHEFVHQYFYGIVANNEVYEAWLDEGLATYLTSKIMEKYYGRRVISFDLFNYYPIFGLNFLSYNEIPLIYSLGEFYYPEGATSLARYLRSPKVYAITDTSYLLPEPFIYGNASYSKPHLVLISLERYLGFNNMMEIFRKYYNKYKFKHPTGKDFLSIIQENSKEDIKWFFELFYGTSVYDYRIKYVRAASNEPYTYDVFIERLGDGIFKQDIVLYTDKDTLRQVWNGTERWKLLKFRTSNKVIGAETDPLHKNILDLDYSNNSYFIKYQYGGSIGLTLRWFFWMQNLLLILGSIA